MDTLKQKAEELELEVEVLREENTGLWGEISTDVHKQMTQISMPPLYR